MAMFVIRKKWRHTRQCAGASVTAEEFENAYIKGSVQDLKPTKRGSAVCVDMLDNGILRQSNQDTDWVEELPDVNVQQGIERRFMREDTAMRAMTGVLHSSEQGALYEPVCVESRGAALMDENASNVSCDVGIADSMVPWAREPQTEMLDTRRNSGVAVVFTTLRNYVTQLTGGVQGQSSLFVTASQSPANPQSPDSTSVSQAGTGVLQSIANPCELRTDAPPSPIASVASLEEEREECDAPPSSPSLPEGRARRQAPARLSRAVMKNNFIDPDYQVVHEEPMQVRATTADALLQSAAGSGSTMRRRSSVMMQENSRLHA